jgi:hypothetical protein
LAFFSSAKHEVFQRGESPGIISMQCLIQIFRREF